MADEGAQDPKTPDSERERIAALLTSYSRGGAEGLNEIRMFLATRSPDPTLLEWLCMGFYTNKLYEECIEVCQEIKKTSPMDVKALFYEANSHFHMGRLDEARRGWQKVVEADPTSPLAHKSQERLQGRKLPKRAEG